MGVGHTFYESFCFHGRRELNRYVEDTFQIETKRTEQNRKNEGEP